MDYEEIRNIVERAKMKGIIREGETYVPKPESKKEKRPRKRTWPRKKYKCRWCGFLKKRKGVCPSCGKKSNIWSAKRYRG
jgi:rubrerythrin